MSAKGKGRSTPIMSQQRIVVPAGFSGWWCQRCEKPVSLPEELGSPARCPHCRKPTAVWVPPADPLPDPEPVERDHRPRAARGVELFAHMRAVVLNPGLNPDLRKIEEAQG